MNQIAIQQDRRECEVLIEPGTIIEDKIPNHIPLNVFANKRYVTTFVFDTDQPLAGELVTPTLHKLSELTLGIIETFATHLLGQNS